MTPQIYCSRCELEHTDAENMLSDPKMRCISALKARQAQLEEEKLAIEQELEEMKESERLLPLFRKVIDADLAILLHEADCKQCLPLKDCESRHDIAMFAAQLRDEALGEDEREGTT